MPLDASALEREPYDRVLFLGDPHIGKSTSIVSSAIAAFGPGYVINCGKATGLLDASRRSKKFMFDLVRDEKGMEDALIEARRGCKEGRYKWVVFDDLNFYADWLEGALEDVHRNQKSGEVDGRRMWRPYKQKLKNILVRAFDWKAHVYVISHYIETGGLIDGQTEKTGPGVAPLFGGAARKEIPGMFANVVLMAPHTKDRGKRSFFINPVGVYGPSCLDLPDTHELEPDVGLLHQKFEEFANGEKKAEKKVAKK